MTEVDKSEIGWSFVAASETGPNIKRTFSVRILGPVRYPTIGHVNYTVEI